MLLRGHYIHMDDIWGIPTVPQDIHYTVYQCQGHCIYIVPSRHHIGCHENHVGRKHMLKNKINREYSKYEKIMYQVMQETINAITVLTRTAIGSKVISSRCTLPTPSTNHIRFTRALSTSILTYVDTADILERTHPITVTSWKSGDRNV